MNSKEVVIDTNFFMVPFQFNVDIITELENKLPSYKLTTPSFVINELKGLKRNNKGKIRLNANLALKLANSSKVEIRIFHYWKMKLWMMRYLEFQKF